MPNRPDDQAAGAGPVETPGLETPDFEVEDARLGKALRHVERERAGRRGAEFGHDENYTPGIHEGGTRFGFFNGGDHPTPPKGPGKS